MNQRGVQLGDLVREMRKSKHLTQEALAERVGVCKRTIRNFKFYSLWYVSWIFRFFPFFIRKKRGNSG